MLFLDEVLMIHSSIKCFLQSPFKRFFELKQQR